MLSGSLSRPDESPLDRLASCHQFLVLSTPEIQGRLPARHQFDLLVHLSTHHWMHPWVRQSTNMGAVGESLAVGVTEAGECLLRVVQVVGDCLLVVV